LEKNRIYHAALGWLIIQLSWSVVAIDGAQGQPQPDVSRPDTTERVGRSSPDDTLLVEDKERAPKEKVPDEAEKARAAETAVAKSDDELVSMSAYEQRMYISRGAADEIRHLSRYYLVTSGDVGQPQLLYNYLNAAGPDITINGLPFVYGGVYRPYLVAFDVDVLPWEILRGATPRNNVLDISLGIPRDTLAGSDVELSRGPYGYSGTRWRFMQPVGKDMYAFFTVGFRKSNGYFPSTDYDGYHVTGGVKKSLLGGDAELDVWKHRARYGLRSFDYLVSQLYRQSRGIDRYEFRFRRPVTDPVSLRLLGVYQRSAKTVSGYGEQAKTRYDLGGGRGWLNIDLPGLSADGGVAYYHVRLYGLADRRPHVNQFEYFARVEGRQESLRENLNLEYSWNGIDHGAFVPEGRVSYNVFGNLGLFAEFSRRRKLPDLLLLYFDDYVTGLGSGQTLETYRFNSTSSLRMPVSSRLSLGLEFDRRKLGARLTVSDVRVDDQIRLGYSADTSGNVVVWPLNFDDRYMEIEGKVNGSLGPFSGEFSAIYRKWDEKYFADGLEKGPAAGGFGRLSFLRQFFIKDLYLGGSLQMQAASRRDYRSILVGYTDAYVVFDGRLEFRYKDFTFWLNENNLLDTRYYSLWPYPEKPRTVWWGFRWKFLG
jgi:hypothetical protein